MVSDRLGRTRGVVGHEGHVQSGLAGPPQVLGRSGDRLGTDVDDAVEVQHGQVVPARERSRRLLQQPRPPISRATPTILRMDTTSATGSRFALHPFRALRLADSYVGDPVANRVFARPYRAVPARLRDWRRKRHLRVDPRPALYLHEYTSAGVSIRGVVALLDLPGGRGTGSSRTRTCTPTRSPSSPTGWPRCRSTRPRSCSCTADPSPCGRPCAPPPRRHPTSSTPTRPDSCSASGGSPTRTCSSRWSPSSPTPAQSSPTATTGTPRRSGSSPSERAPPGTRPS